MTDVDFKEISLSKEEINTLIHESLDEYIRDLSDRGVSNGLAGMAKKALKHAFKNHPDRFMRFCIISGMHEQVKRWAKEVKEEENKEQQDDK